MDTPASPQLVTAPRAESDSPAALVVELSRPTAPPAPAARWAGVHRVDLDECGSTNDEAARLARAGARHGTVVTARTQSAGRGRAGRTWSSPVGNLYVSLVLRPPLLLRDVPAMTLAIGVAVCETARSFGVAAELKWPNDVLVGERKLAGVLLESQSRGDRVDVVVAGVGLNLDAAPDAALAPNAACLAREAGVAVDREVLLAQLLAAIERWVDRYVASGLTAVIPAWSALMSRATRARARVGGRELIGTLEGLDDGGALLLRDDDGQLHCVIAGDIETVRAADEAAVPAQQG